MNKTKLFAYGVAFSLILAGSALLSSCSEMMDSRQDHAAAYTVSAPSTVTTTSREVQSSPAQSSASGEPAKPASKAVMTPAVPLEAPSVSTTR